MPEPENYPPMRPLGHQSRIERLRYRLGIPATMPRRVYAEPWRRRLLARLIRR